MERLGMKQGILERALAKCWVRVFEDSSLSTLVDAKCVAVSTKQGESFKELRKRKVS